MINKNKQQNIVNQLRAASALLVLTQPGF